MSFYIETQFDDYLQKYLNTVVEKLAINNGEACQFWQETEDCPRLHHALFIINESGQANITCHSKKYKCSKCFPKTEKSINNLFERLILKTTYEKKMV